MVRLIYKACIFLAVGFSLAYLLQLAIDSGLRKSDYTVEYKEWYDITEGQVNADILIEGNSKVKAQISPANLQREFKLVAYNMGIDGAYFQDMNFKFKEYIKHNKLPKYIIQSVDAILFKNDNPNDNQLNFIQFVPYVNQDLLDNFNGHTIFGKKDLYIPLYKYSHQYGLTIAGLNYIFKKPVKDNGTYRGFVPYNHKYNPKPFKETFLKNGPEIKILINDTVYRDFVGFINFCKTKKIKLILVNTPAFIAYQNKFIDKNALTKLYSGIAKQYNLTYLDYSNEPMCKDVTMYADFMHLNTRGVKIFNKKLVQDLRAQIK